MDFLAEHAYAVLFAWVFLNQLGLPVPSMPYMLGAGALAGMGQASLPLLVVLTLAATLPADLLWYEIGRRRGMSVLQMVCRISLEPDSCVRDTQGRFARHGARSMLVSKFVPGMETVAPPLAGLLGMQRSRFLLYDSLGTLFWAGSVLGLGFVFNQQIDRVVREAARLGTGLLVILLTVLALYIGWKIVRRRRFLAELRVARISPEELHARLEAGEDIDVVDVRHAVDFEARPEWVLGARHIPLEDFEARHHEISRDREVVLYCT